MQIQYYGDYCIKVTTKPGGRATEDVVLWVDPSLKDSGFRAAVGQADVVFITHGSADPATFASLKGEPVVIASPGEYAVAGLAAIGLPAFHDAGGGAERGQNTVFLAEVEEMRLCFLGALGHELPAADIETIGGVDILFVPVGGTDTLEVAKAAELVRRMQPKAVVPIHYQMPGMSTTIGELVPFKAEFGNPAGEALAKWTVKKKDLEEKVMEFVTLERGT